MKGIFLVVALALFGQAPNFVGRHITAGRLIGAPVFGPGDLVFAASEDQRLHFLSADGKVLDRFNLGARFAYGPVHGSGTWIAVVTRDRRIHRLDYSPPATQGGGRLSLTWSATFSDEPSGPPALLPGGRVALGFRSGSLRVWESTGALAWSHQADENGGEAPLASDSEGRLWWAQSRRLGVWDSRGRPLGVTALPEDAARMVLDTHGRTWILSVTGRVFRVNRAGGPLVVLNYRGVLDMLAPEDGGLWMVFGRSVRRFDINARRTAEIAAPVNLAFGAVLTSDEVLAVPVVSGGFWFSNGATVAQGLPVIENASLSTSGLLVGSGRDWNLYLIRLRPPPKLGWHQSSGSSDGGHRVRRILVPVEQRTRWEGYNGFRIARVLLTRGARSDHELILQNLERASEAGQLDTIPYAQGLLIEICQGGIERLHIENFELRNDWPDLRLRAVRLLAEVADFGSRDTLLLLLRREHDEAVRVVMVGILSRWRWDEDGRGAATLADILQARSTPGLALAALEFLEALKSGPGLSATAQNTRLVRLLLTGNFPREWRARAWALQHH